MCVGFEWAFFLLVAMASYHAFALSSHATITILAWQAVSLSTLSEEHKLFRDNSTSHPRKRTEIVALCAAR
jgi:hypothetical protein